MLEFKTTMDPYSLIIIDDKNSMIGSLQWHPDRKPRMEMMPFGFGDRSRHYTLDELIQITEKLKEASAGRNHL